MTTPHPSGADAVVVINIDSVNPARLTFSSDLTPAGRLAFALCRYRRESFGSAGSANRAEFDASKGALAVVLRVSAVINNYLIRNRFWVRLHTPATPTS